MGRRGAKKRVAKPLSWPSWLSGSQLKWQAQLGLAGITANRSFGFSQE